MCVGDDKFAEKLVGVVISHKMCDGLYRMVYVALIMFVVCLSFVFFVVVVDKVILLLSISLMMLTMLPSVRVYSVSTVALFFCVLL